MSEVQGEGNVAVYSDVFEVHDEGNVTVYSDVCLRYRVREMLLCTVMCAQVQGEGNVIVQIDVCLKYSVREKFSMHSDVCLKRG